MLSPKFQEYDEAKVDLLANVTLNESVTEVNLALGNTLIVTNDESFLVLIPFEVVKITL